MYILYEHMCDCTVLLQVDHSALDLTLSLLAYISRDQELAQLSKKEVSKQTKEYLHWHFFYLCFASTLN